MTPRDLWSDDQLMPGPSLYPAGVTLFREGDRIRTLHLIVSGIVKVFCSCKNRDVLIALRTKGWLLGAAAAVAGPQHRFTAVTLTDSELRPIDTTSFHSLRGNDPALGLWLGKMLADEVCEQFWRAATMVRSNGRSRVEELFSELFDLCGQLRPDGSMRLFLPLTVTHIADLIAVTREQASRLLGVLAADGILFREQGWFVTPPGSPFAGSALHTSEEPSRRTLGSRKL